MKWLPIESAPKDGTNILCWNGFEIYHAFYTYENEWREAGFHIVDSDTHGPLASVYPTHWMPLPPPPKATE